MTEIPVARVIPPRLLPVLAVVVGATAPRVAQGWVSPHHPVLDQ